MDNLQSTILAICAVEIRVLTHWWTQGAVCQRSHMDSVGITQGCLCRNREHTLGASGSVSFPGC